MKPYFALVVAIILVYSSYGQSDTLLYNEVSNSYAKDMKRSHPELHYNYDNATLTHDYSGNWDIDGDGRKDSVWWIGNGGAHLYYHLRIKLSSAKKYRDNSFIACDLPALDKYKEIQGKELSVLPQFVVKDFNGDGRDDLYVNTDINYSPIPYRWKRRDVTSRYLLLTYQKGELVIKNFR